MPFCDIVGHERVKEILVRSVKNARVSHAYLFVGPEGVGKRHTALAFAKALNCAQREGDYCDACSVCRKIGRFCHPDVLLVEPEGSSLKIEQIREYQRDVSLKAWEGRYKILILDGTDKLTPEAANSLLKTLEEPPPATVIILISVNPFSLFPTLLSRCQLIRFGPLKKVETAKILKEGQLLDESQARLLVSLCGGKVGQALALDLDHVLSMREQVWELLKPDEGSSVDFLIRRARELSKDKEELDFLLSLLSSLSRDIVVLASGSDLSFLMNEDIGAKLYGLAKSLSPTQALKVWETIEQAREFLRQNVNGQLVLESMLVDIYRLLR